MPASIEAELKIIKAGTSSAVPGTGQSGNKELTEALKEMKRFFRRPQNIFGGGGGGAGIGKTLIGVGLSVGMIATQILNPELMEKLNTAIDDILINFSNDIINGYIKSLTGVNPGKDFMNMGAGESLAEIFKSLFGKDTPGRPPDNTAETMPGFRAGDITGATIDNLTGVGSDSANNGLFNFGQKKEVIKNQEDIMRAEEEVLRIMEDQIITEEEKVRLKELQNALDDFSTKKQEESLGLVSDEERVHESILGMNSQRLEVLEMINEGLNLTKEGTDGVASAQANLNSALQKEVDLRRRLASLSNDKKNRFTSGKGSDGSSTRLDTPDGRTFAIFDTAALGGTKAFEIR